MQVNPIKLCLRDIQNQLVSYKRGHQQWWCEISSWPPPIWRTRKDGWSTAWADAVCTFIWWVLQTSMLSKRVILKILSRKEMGYICQQTRWPSIKHAMHLAGHKNCQRLVNGELLTKCQQNQQIPSFTLFIPCWSHVQICKATHKNDVKL